MVVTFLLNLIKSPADLFHRMIDLDVLHVRYFGALGGDGRYFTVFEIDHAVGVFQNGGDVGSHEVLTFTVAHHQR